MNLKVLFLACFCSIIQILGQKSFSKKCDSVTHNLIRVSRIIAKFRESHSKCHSKETPGKMAGWKGRQDLVHRALPVTSRDRNSTKSVDWHLKVKDIECDDGITKIIASQPVCKISSQFINSFLTYSRF